MQRRWLHGVLLALITALVFSAYDGLTTELHPHGQPSDSAPALLRQAENHIFHARYNRSIQILLRAKAQCEGLPAAARDSACSAALARSYLLLGENYRSKSDVKRARHYLLQGVDSCKSWLGEATPLEAAFYEQLGQLHQSTGDIAKFRLYALKGLELRRKLFKGDAPEIAESLDSVGWAEMMAGNIAAAERNLQQALEIRSAQKPPQKLELAKSFFSLYRYNNHCGRYQEMRDYAERTLACALPAVGKKHPLVAEGYIALGNYAISVQEYDRAIAWYQKAHAILVGLFGPVHHRTIATLTNLASGYAGKGDLAKSVSFHNQARRVTLQLYGENIWYANSCTYLGQVYALQHDYPNALQWYQKSIEVQLRLGTPILPQLQLQYNEMARIKISQGEPRAALEYLDKCFASYRPKPILDAGLTPEEGHWPADEGFWSALCLRAEALQRITVSEPGSTQNLQSALDSYRIAAAAIETIRNSVQSEAAAFQPAIIEFAVPVYDGAVRTALEMYDRTTRPEFAGMAFGFAQNGKAAVLARSLQVSKAVRNSGIPEAISQQETELSRQMRSARLALDLGMQQGLEPDSETYQNLRQSWIAAQDGHHRLIRQLERDYPAYHALKYQSAAVSVTALQGIIDEDTALLDYYLADSTLYLFAVTSSDFIVRPCGPAREVAAASETFRAALKSGSRKSSLQIGAALYQKLIAPVMPAISARQKLLICPHAALFGIPFEALVVGLKGEKPTFLLQQFGLAYNYSATIFYQQASTPGRLAARPAVVSDLVAFAPFSDKGKYAIGEKGLFSGQFAAAGRRPAWITRDGEHFTDLPGSLLEVKGISSAFSAHQFTSKTFIGEEATKKNLFAAIGSARFVHLATHSFINEASPSLSGIAFSNPAYLVSQTDQVGILFLGEVYNLECNADLVVLSSCESGMGKLIKGEGMIALTRGFLYAGARNVMVSLWKVEDQHTSELMIDFYRRVLAGESFSSALRQAKLDLLKNNTSISPSVWASFVLFGR